MGFVDNDESRRRNIPPGQGLCTDYLNGRVWIGPAMRTLNDANVPNPLALESVKGLLHQR
jgi:hypothetical protein